MKFTTLTASAILGLTTVASGASCARSESDNESHYDIWANNVFDIAGRCAGLWANLQNRGCDVLSGAYCGGIEETHILNWRFSSWVWCTAGNVEGAWWEATTNNFGSIDC